MALKVHVVCIDHQNDFTDPNGSLFVKGGTEDVERTARMIERLSGKITDITLTMDSHRKVDISHPMWWVDQHGKSPDPYTMISPDDVESGKWTTRVPSHRERSLKYLMALSATNRYPHVIWPEHCLIGSWGTQIHPTLLAAVHQWEERRYAMFNAVTKGSNPWTEHFSAVRAEVPDPTDPSTQTNQQFVSALEDSDMVLWTGEALSHCLANTFRDAISSFANGDHIKKMVLLTDATSSVGGFENFGDAFLQEMTARGMRTDTTTNILT